MTRGKSTVAKRSHMIPGNPDWIDSYPGGREKAMAELRRVGACRYLHPCKEPDWVIDHPDGRREGIWTGAERVYPHLQENQPYKFPPMPPEASNPKERHFFLGWATSKEELKTFRGPQTYGLVREARPVVGIESLWHTSGFKDLQQVMVERMERLEEQEVEILLTGVSASASSSRDSERVPCIMLWVNSVELDHPIPTQGQVDKLVRTFGRQPAWYRDIYEREEFHKHGLFILQWM